jgi:hypothetical protein
MKELNNMLPRHLTPMTTARSVAATAGAVCAIGVARMKVWHRMLGLLAIAAISLPAATLSFTGTFATDDQVQLFNFTLTSGSIVTFQSLGYGGGTNAAGTIIPPGGFDSFFTWFDATGDQIGTDDDGCGAAASNNGACLDAYFQGFLPAGDYVLALTESGNEPNGSLSDGFTEQGMGDFTASGACPAFCDSFGNQDNGNWAVDISGVDGPSPVGVPEPASFALTFCGLSLFALARRWRTLSHSSQDN